MKRTLSSAMVLAMALAATVSAAAADRVLRAEVELAAPVEDVWRAWTTEEGVKTFFAKGAHIEPQVDGAYEIFFNPAGAPGKRGADGMRVLAFEADAAYDYFDHAWGAVVLPRLKRRFESGPLDLDTDIKLPPVAPSLRLTLRGD